MEQVSEREAAPQTGYRVYKVYDDDGSQIRNPDILKGIAEAQEFIAMWEKMVED
ncbi:MAG: hypothetical protein IJG65_00055 [Synergistaceae bacterium]|nr:hypothetical protein [Synergistaceae bacterium]